MVPQPNLISLKVLVVAFLATGITLAGQQPQTAPAAGAPGAQGPAAGQRTGAPPGRRPILETTKATASGPAANVLAFEEKLDAAIREGDTAAVNKALAADFVAYPDDHWSTGGKTKVESRAEYLKLVTTKVYLVRDLDQVHIEMHPEVNVGITFGRFVTLARAGGDGKLMSTFYQRVYAQRNGDWQLLSERTVSGPVAAPAGVDPTEADNSANVWGTAPVLFLTDPAPPYVPKTDEEKELAQLDQKIGTAVVSGDVNYVRSMTSSDFSMVHGDPWIRGGRPILKDTQESMLSRVGKSYGVLDFDHIRVEVHGDVAITDGRYLARSNGASADRAWFSVWFERVFVKKDGKWIYISHRTTHGPAYGPSREAVSKE